MKVLIACEFSGIVRNEFVKLGHDAMSCDLLPSETERPDGWDGHYQGDVRELLADPRYSFDLMIAHPPCTRLANSGVRWLHERDLWKELEEAAALFKAVMNAKIERIAIENPIPHKYALEMIGRKYDQIIQPYYFGEGETKATCIWLKNLPPLVSTEIVQERKARVHRESPGPERWKNRSRTLPGIAKAFAMQWGGIA